MDLEITKITGIDLAAKIGAVLVELTNPMEQSDDPQHFHNHVTFSVFVQHPDAAKLSIPELRRAAIAEAEKVLKRITSESEAPHPFVSTT